MIYLKKLMYVVLFISSSISFAATQQTDREQILAVISAQEDAWNQGDLEKYMQGYWKSEKLRFASEGNYKFGWQKTLDGYKKAYPNKDKMGTLMFTVYDVNILSEDAALVFGAWQLQRKQDQPQGLFTLLFKKIRKHGWKIVADHTSSAAQ